MPFKKGISSWNKGIKYSDKMKKNMNFQSGNKFGCANRGKKKGPRPLKLRLQHSAWLKLHPQRPWLGKKFSKKHIENIVKGRKGYRHSLATRKKNSDSKKGNKCYAWKGGITPLTKKIRFSFEYKLWRSDVFKRDNWTCQTCRKRGDNLVAHHIKLFSTIIKDYKIKTLKMALQCKELWDINNAVTLCENCHNLTKKGRTSNV